MVGREALTVWHWSVTSKEMMYCPAALNWTVVFCELPAVKVTPLAVLLLVVEALVAFHANERRVVSAA
jgi:hypothetical protein